MEGAPLPDRPRVAVDRLFGVRSVLLRAPGASLLLPGLTGEEAAALAALALEGGGEG